MNEIRVFTDTEITDMKREVVETLMKQLQLLHERSGDCDDSFLGGISEQMRNISAFLLYGD